MKDNLLYIGFISLLLAMSACESGTNEFPDYDYQTVYFASQYPVRTLELGEDEFVDLTLDNRHTVSIKAAWGGGYTNRRDVVIDYVVDPSLCDGLYFAEGGVATGEIEVMPESYYQLQSDKIYMREGQILGGVDVKLTDAFFADPKSVTRNYAIPVRMTGVVGADSILSGRPAVENPSWTTSSDWTVQPQNFVVYVVRFVNPRHGQYLRRGVDNVVTGGVMSTNVRHNEYVEKDEEVEITTLGLKTNVLPVTVKDAAGTNLTVNLLLNFADDGTCTLGSADEKATVSGSGKFVSKGVKNSLGGKDRDAIYLDYSVELKDKGVSVVTKDTLVLRTRNVKAEFYSVIKK